jgi:hypothetical protein
MPSYLLQVYMEATERQNYPYYMKGMYIPLKGNMVKTWYFSSGSHAFATVHVLPT